MSGERPRDIFGSSNNPIFDMYLCNTKVTDDMIYLPEEIIEDVEDLINNINNPESFGYSLGFHGYLFRGPPGTGKTLTSQYVATKTDSDLRQVSAFRNPVEVVKFFKYVRECSEENTQIVLLDDIDGLSNRQDIVDSTQSSVLTQLLTEINGVESNKNIYFIGTSNYFEKLDNALMRYKRLGKVIDFHPPNEKGRYEILKIMAYNLSKERIKDGHNFCFKKGDLEKLAEKTYGYTGDDLYGVLSQAANYSNRHESVNVTREELMKAKDKIAPTALKDMPFKIPEKSLDDLVCLEMHSSIIREAMENFGADSEGVNFLFYGPPGTGKSSLAEAISDYYKFNFVTIEGSQLVNSLVGRTGDMIERVFSRCESSAPTILLLDEFHSLVHIREWRGFVDNWTPRIRSRLSNGLKGVCIFATIPENMYDQLDKETLDRFEYKLCFNLPEKEERISIWEHYFEKNNINPEKFHMGSLADISEGVSGREIEQVCSLISRHNIRIREQGVIEKLLDYYKKNDRINHVRVYEILTSPQTVSIDWGDEK